MKEYFLSILALVLFWPGLAIGQQQDYHVYLAAGDLPVAENLDEFLARPGLVPGEELNGHYIRLIQFHTTPTATEKARIEGAGIRLLDYIPNYAFVSAIPVNFDRQKLRSLNVRSVHRLEPGLRLSRNLQDRPLPDWTLKAPGKVDVQLSFIRLLDREEVKSRLRALGYEMLGDDYPGSVSLRLPTAQLESLTELPYVLYVEPVNPPAEPENYTGRTLHRSNVIASDYQMGRHYDGTGVVVALGDDGIIGPHIDYEGRVDLSNVTSNSGNHGDHVAGIIFGAGNLDPTRKGMAFGASVMAYNVWDAVNSGPSSNPQYGVMLTSTSYGNGCNAGYNSFAQSADAMARTTPTLMHVFSTGNSGTSNCGYGAGAGWGNITGGVKIGKNVLAVANLNDNGGLAGSSSRGPSTDGRIKPDIAAKGSSVWSTIDVNSYANFSGTSMAAPGVTGTFAQLIHAYRNLHNGQDPQAALIKAVLLNTADDLGNPGPDFSYGWGEINARRAVEALENETYRHDSITQGQTDTFQLTVPAGAAQVKVMLYWPDYEGAVNASVALVNDLDFTLTDPSSNVWQPWVLNPAPNAVTLDDDAVRGTDNLNNMEQVTLDAPAAGTYVFTVAGTNIPQGPQKYYVVYEIQDSSVTLTYPLGGEGIRPGDLEKIRWDAWGDFGTWTLDYTTDNGSSWVNAATNLAGSRRYHDFAVPQVQSGEVRFRVSRGGQSDESDHNLSFMAVPSNLQVIGSCPASTTLGWDSIPTASAYDIFQLGSTYMDSIGTTANASYRVQGTDPNATYWFAVRARAADGAQSRRTIAIQKVPGLFNCQDPDDAGVSEVISPEASVFQSCAGFGTFPVRVLVENHGSNALTNIPVSYQLNAQTAVTETLAGPLQPYATDTFTFSTPISLGAGMQSIRAWTELQPDNWSPNDSVQSYTETYAGSVVALPFAEDFEGFGLCPTTSNCEVGTCATANGWYQGTNNRSDALDWRTNRGATPTGGTGPSEDHNPGTSTGHYMYLESSACFQKDAMLYTPCIDLTTALNPGLEFWFHENGNTMGRLHVDAYVNGGWQNDITPSISWNWGDNWRRRPVDLTAFAGSIINLRFRGTTGPGDNSDMAIDDISITDLSIGIDPQSQPLLEVYPNPNSGKFNFTIMKLNAENIRLKIVDLTGRIVIQQEFLKFTDELSGQFDLTDQSSGVYYLKVEADGQTFGKKISLQR